VSGDPSAPHQPPPPLSPNWRHYVGLGTELAGAICGLTLLGYWIDRKYVTGNKGVLIGAGIGVIGGMYNFLRQAIALSKETEKEAHEESDERHHHDQ
jgi:F0F1-type ATP synthase assembly protein I